MFELKKQLDLLGYQAEDRVTAIKGIITSISFDLYGCIQILLNPGIDKDGKLRDLVWLDVNRVKVLSEKPVMDQPNFNAISGPMDLKGPEKKPVFGI